MGILVQVEVGRGRCELKWMRVKGYVNGEM